jgi:predicted phosphodiesterase
VRVAVITDVHEDVVSLKRALRMIEIEKCDQIVCLGDIVGYPYLRGSYEKSRNVSECISLIMSNCSMVVAGNHDIFHLRKLPEYANGFRFPHDWYEMPPEMKTMISGGRVWNYSDDCPVALNDSEIEFIDSLPEYALLEAGDRRVLLSHSLFPNLTGYVSEKTGSEGALPAHFEFMAKNRCGLSLCGHMHIEGLGISYEIRDSLFQRFFRGFRYFPYGRRRIRSNRCCVTIPALADNSQVNGFAVFDSTEFSINALSLNANRLVVI